MVLKSSKKVHFLKPKSVKAIYIYTPERSHYILQKMVFFSMLTYCFRDIRVWSRGILLNFCRVTSLVILIANISWTVVQTPINYIIFWKSEMRTFRCKCVNCFNRLWFLADVRTKLRKFHFFRQFEDYNGIRTRNHLARKRTLEFRCSHLNFKYDACFEPVSRHDTNIHLRAITQKGTWKLDNWTHFFIYFFRPN